MFHKKAFKQIDRKTLVTILPTEYQLIDFGLLMLSMFLRNCSGLMPNCCLKALEKCDRF